MHSCKTPVNEDLRRCIASGPSRFLIYINHLPENISSKICPFARDCVIYRQISNEDDITIFQKDLTNVLNCFKLWKMELNVSECRSMHISRNAAACRNCLLNTGPLDSFPLYEYLGVHTSNNLSRKRHVCYMQSRVLGFMRTNFYSPCGTKKLLHTTYACPHLQCASSVWDHPS